MTNFRFVATMLVVALSFAAGSAACVARQHEAVHSVGESIRFSTTGSPETQKQFIAGVRLLHNFEYDDAIVVFRDTVKAQPDFAMGYWGLAMSYNHPLWGEQDLEQARKALLPLNKLGTNSLSPREKGFIDAVRLLFGEGDKAHRDAAYAKAMGRLYAQFPRDDEVATLYGLALLGTRSESHDFLITVRASDVLERVYARNPDHPGVLHYLVHCYDDPRFASLGLTAAGRYGDVATGSPHALHMPSHIYLDQGMWEAFVRSNEASWRASQDRIDRRHLGSGGYDIHALHTLLWLEYGYLQQGRFAEAMERLRSMVKIESVESAAMARWYFAMMWSTYVVDAIPDVKTLSALRDVHLPAFDDLELSARASTQLADGLIAARDGKRAQLTGAIQSLDELVRGMESSTQSSAHHHDTSFFTSPNPAAVAPAKVARMQLQALLLFGDGKIDKAVDQLQEAVAAEAALPVGYGPPVPVKPSAELLGEIYLASGQPQSAMRAFQLALLRYPERSMSLVGLAESARRAGDTKTASAVEKKLATHGFAAGARHRMVNSWPCGHCSP